LVKGFGDACIDGDSAEDSTAPFAVLPSMSVGGNAIR
jgi:hypothetical protein